MWREPSIFSVQQFWGLLIDEIVKLTKNLIVCEGCKRFSIVYLSRQRGYDWRWINAIRAENYPAQILRNKSRHGVPAVANYLMPGSLSLDLNLRNRYYLSFSDIANRIFLEYEVLPSFKFVKGPQVNFCCL